MKNGPKSTPAAQWRAAGEVDPHAGRYDGERAALALGYLSDDELANGAFMNYDGALDIQRILAKDPDYHSPIAWMSAVKDRIRWLSRKVEDLLLEDAELKANAARYLFVRGASTEVSLEMHAIGTQNLLDEYIDAAIAKASS